MNVPGRIVFLNCPIDPLTREQVLERCLRWCRERNSPRTVITLNATVMMMMRRDRQLFEACTAGDLILADGMSVVWAARMAGPRIPERMAGVDLMKDLLAEASRSKLRVFFLGAREEVLAKLIRMVKQQYPGVVIAGYRNGYFEKSEYDIIINNIRKSMPHMLFVGMPSPFKEVWCQKYREQLQTPLIMGVGGSFDVLAGVISRAPQWLQNIGMEWSWRLLQEPRRMWKRYLVNNTKFIATALVWGTFAKREKKE